MTAEQREGSESSKPWQRRAWTQLLAVGLGVLPLYSIGIILQLRGDHQLTVQAFIWYLAVVSPLSIALALFLLRFLCGEHPRDLNLIPSKLSSDLVSALVLSVVILAANVTANSFLSQLLPESASDESVRNLFLALAGNPGLLALFLGLLILLGAASEEVIRVFLLSRLWRVWPSVTGKLVAVVISACLFGLLHLYQGPVGAAWTGIFGLITALYYLRFGRVLPLILAHYLTNALQVVVFVLMRA